MNVEAWGGVEPPLDGVKAALPTELTLSVDLATRMKLAVGTPRFPALLYFDWSMTVSFQYICIYPYTCTYLKAANICDTLI